MALQDDQNVASIPGITSRPAAVPKSVEPKEFGAGTGTLAVLTPVAVNSATGKWVPWNPEVVSEMVTIGTTGTVSGGTFTLTVNGETTAAIAWNASAATIATALLALGGIDPGDVVVTGDMPASSLDFSGGQLAGSNITTAVNSGSITGGGAVTLLTEQNGAASNNVNIIKGFVWPYAITLNASGEVIGNVFMAGDIDYSSIPLTSDYTQNELAAGLRDGNLRSLGIFIKNLPGFN